MKYHEKTLTAALTAVLAACVLLSACSSSGSDAATPEDTPTVENVTTGPTAEPTTSSSEPGGTLQLDEVNDDDLIAAALAAYETAPQPEGTIAWDVLDTSVFEDQVSFTMCTWDGLTANDAMRDIKYITTITDGGTIEARNVQSSPTSGDCLNTQLIESAIATANFQEEFWESVALAPETFVDSDVPAQLFTDFAPEAGRFPRTLWRLWLGAGTATTRTKACSNSCHACRWTRRMASIEGTSSSMTTKAVRLVAPIELIFIASSRPPAAASAGELTAPLDRVGVTASTQAIG